MEAYYPPLTEKEKAEKRGLYIHTEKIANNAIHAINMLHIYRKLCGNLYLVRDMLPPGIVECAEKPYEEKCGMTKEKMEENIRNGINLFKLFYKCIIIDLGMHTSSRKEHDKLKSFDYPLARDVFYSMNDKLDRKDNGALKEKVNLYKKTLLDFLDPDKAVDEELLKETTTYLDNLSQKTTVIISQMNLNDMP